jgi:hypothetical protein
MKSSTLSLAMALCITAGGSHAFSQSRDTAPINPVAINTELIDGWRIEIIADAKTTTTRLSYSWSALLKSTRASIAIKDCGRVAEAIDEAATAVRNGKRFENEEFGHLMITTGTGKVTVTDKDGGYLKDKDGNTLQEDRQVVIIHGGESGMFTEPYHREVLPDDAAKFARALRKAPGIAARLKSAIDLDAIWKAN